MVKWGNRVNWSAKFMAVFIGLVAVFCATNINGVFSWMHPKDPIRWEEDAFLVS